ncbi:SCO-spondin-like isoform X2 [Ruditapes philippinarum]|uniref:SCO-spondin-like isoform X2 n=1 Tax=Ruditapes philippinarum TaxID=129788 RepID=UPI00295AE9A6|nr:SCO-spondin-like isoform X2 [Ruditapes philippinarum]
MEFKSVIQLLVCVVCCTSVLGQDNCNDTETPSIKMCQTTNRNVRANTFIYLDSGGAPILTKVECTCTLRVSGSGSFNVEYRAIEQITNCEVDFTMNDRTWGCQTEQLSVQYQGSNNLTFIKKFNNRRNWLSCLGIMTAQHDMTVECYPYRIYYAPDEVVDGGFSDWSFTSECSVTCGTGVRTRERRCNNPYPRNNGSECLAEDGTRTLVETGSVSCESSCEVNGAWGPWINTSSCSTTCGTGSLTQTRSCDSPAPNNDGEYCLTLGGNRALEENRTIECFIIACPVNGGWSDWSGWGTCSSSCGGGIRNRTRLCTNPQPLYGGAQCLGNSIQSEYCGIGNCPINGNWSPWSTWNICSRTCGGGGYQSRYRACDNPYPQNGGFDCTGDSTEIKTCGEADCPVNGAWGSWEPWLQCSQNCGLGTQTRYRYCDSPIPQNGGKTCTGYGLETKDCNGNSCPINGQWGYWTSWTICSTSCGPGTYSRNRKCDSPAPKNGGQICSGNSYENGQCSIGVCIDDEAWSPWSPWSSCSKSCGEGKVSRTRDCYSPEPNHVGNYCLGDRNESVSCILRKCAVNGNWGIWSPWSFCSITCGPGSISRIRECNSPGPENGGNSCYGESSEEISCFMLPCPVDGGFGPWSPWSKCSASCGIGEKSRLRECNNPVPANGGKYCSDLDFQSSVCNVTKCPGTGQTTSSQAGFSSETPVTQASVDKKRKEDDSNMGAIIGGTVGGLLLLLLLLLLLVCFIRRRRRKEVKRRPSEGDRSVRYISQGDDVTVTENQLYNYDGETPSHAVNALFVGGIPETPQSPGYIPHFSTDTGDRYAVIMDSNRTKPKTKERPKLDTFNSQEENAKAEPNGDVRASTDTVKLAENYNDDQLGRGVDNPGYEDSYIAPYDSAEGGTKPKTSSSSPSPYDYIDNEKLKRDDADFEDDKLAGDYATLPDDGNEDGDNDAENNERYKRFISSEPEDSADDGYLKSPKRDNVFEFPDTS